MGQPAKLLPTDDPILAAAKRAPFVPLNDEERALIEEAQSDPRPMIPGVKFRTLLAELRPADETDDDIE